MKSRKYHSYVAVLWLLTLFLVGAGILLLSPKKETLSETENRMLQAFPEVSVENITSGDFSTQFESYMTDHVFGRDALVKTVSDIKSLFSTLTFEDLMQQMDGVEDTFVPVTSASDTTDENVTGDVVIEDDPTEAPVVEITDVNNPDDYPERLSIYATRYNGSVETLYSTYKSQVDITAGILNRLAALIPEDGTVSYINVLQAWHANAYVLNTDVTYASWDSNVEGYLSTQVGDKVNVFAITDVLGQAIRDKEYVYFRTDSHWTPRGSYLAYNAMMTAQGVEPVPYDAYTYTPLENFLGAYYRMDPSSEMASKVDTLNIVNPLVPSRFYMIESPGVYKEIPLLKYSIGVAHEVYLGGNGPLRKLISETGTGRTAMIIMDSYGMSFTPYLAPHYDTVYVVDARFYRKRDVGMSLSELITTEGVSDIFVVLSDINGYGKSYTKDYLDQMV